MKKNLVIAVLTVLCVVLVWKTNRQETAINSLIDFRNEQAALLDVYEIRLGCADTLLVDFNSDLSERMKSGQINAKDAAGLLEKIATDWSKLGQK